MNQDTTTMSPGEVKYVTISHHKVISDQVRL